MKITPSNPAPRVALTLILLALGLAILPALHGQLSRFGKVKGFKYYEYYEPLPGLKAQTNQVKAFLAGSEAQYRPDGLVRITQSRIENYPTHGKSTNLVALSPESFFDLDTRLVTSTSALQVVAADGRMVLRGQTGFEISMTNNNLIVSNYVRGFIHESLFNAPRP